MDFFGTAWALVPPLVAIVLALITKEVFSSLFVGILVGSLLTAGFHPIETLNNLISNDITVTVDGEEEEMSLGFVNAISDASNAGIFLFLVLLGIMVALVNSAGGSVAFGQWAARHVKTRVGTQLATFFLGILIFIDDYFNCLTVGAVMRPVTDEQKISRAKLAYIIDSTAAPICMIAPISSWAAAVSSTADDIEGVSGIKLFIEAIPYNFYSLLTLVFVVGIIIMGFDYGPMAKAELAAYKDGELGIEGAEEKIENEKANIFDLLIPVIILIIFSVIGMLYVGGYWDSEGETYHNIADAFGDTDAGVALPWGALVALLISFIYLLARRVISFKKAADTVTAGFKAMVPAMLILTFALTLKLSTKALGADVFVRDIMEGSADSLYKLLPAVIFLVALGLAFSTGTSWGTFGILIPIVTTIFAGQTELLTIGISACLAGAVCGDHISPISDTTVMSSAGANVNHVKHVQTQIPYALSVAAVSFVCFIIAGFVQNWMITLGIGIVLTIGLLFVLRSTVGRKVDDEIVAVA
ncbi:MAG: Na+/H+ antiporter NhaC family protein [Actinomycetaceae bacterium]|nr:Na+/H+ antiporter NhaC family protein [Actinomycetaceae bacterium]